MDRRGFLGAILALGVAPAIVKASSLMPIRSPTSAVLTRGDELFDLIAARMKAAGDAYEQAVNRDLYEQSADIEIYDQQVAAELARITRGSFLPKLIQQVYNTSPLASALLADPTKVDTRLRVGGVRTLPVRGSQSGDALAVR